MDAPVEAEEIVKFEGAFDDPVAQSKKFQTFRYERPDSDAPKALMKLAQTDLVKGAVKVVGPGGPNNFHSHASADTFRMALKGHTGFMTRLTTPSANSTLSRESSPCATPRIDLKAPTRTRTWSCFSLPGSKKA